MTPKTFSQQCRHKAQRALNDPGIDPEERTYYELMGLELTLELCQRLEQAIHLLRKRCLFYASVGGCGACDSCQEVEKLEAE